MKHTLLALAAMLPLSNCSIQRFPLQYEYQTGPYKTVVEKPLDTVWSKVIDYFAYTGISITNMDKASGLIVAGDYSVINSCTTENEFGELKNKKAYVIYEQLRYLGMDLYPTNATANFTVRVKPLEYNKTELNISLVNIKVQRITYDKYGPNTTNFNTTSSGRFEKQLIKAINKSAL